MTSSTAPKVAPSRPSASQEPNGGESWFTTARSAAAFFALSLLYFVPAFLPGRHIFGTDYSAGGYFFFDFVSKRLADWELPGWVPYIYGGLPLSANPGSTFHPVRLLADSLFPTTWILPFIFVVQFGLAGLGMYLLARELGCRQWVSFIAGLAFQFTGITMSAVYAGHDGRVIVATLAPMFFFFLHRGIRTGALAPFVGASATLGMGLLSFQIQSNYYLLLGGALWAAFTLLHLGVHRRSSSLVRAVGLGLSAVAFGFLLASVNFLPFIDYLPESPRGGEGGRGYEYSTSWSMPPAEVISIAVPEQPGILENYQGENPFKLHTEYLGAFVLVMLVLGFAVVRRNRYWWFFGGLALFVLSVAFGGHTPIYRLYYELLPGTTRFRAPSISFFLFALALVTMSALTLEALVSSRDARYRRTRGTRSAEGTEAEPKLSLWLGGIVGVAVVALVVAAGSADGSARDAAMIAGFGRFALFTTLVCGALWLWWGDRLRTPAFMGVLGMLVVIDLWIIDRNFFETWPPPEVTFARDDVVGFLQAQPEVGRVWVLPVPPGGAYRNHGNYLMLFGVEQAGGEHGNQLQRYNEFAGAGEEVYVDWSNYLGAPNFLRAANIRYVISMVELETPMLREVHRGSALIYEHSAALPRAYLVEEVVTSSDSTAALEILASPDFDVARSAVVYGEVPAAISGAPLEGAVNVEEHSPDRVVVRATASRPALLVLADNFYRGWRATVNGEEVPILRTNHTFRGVVVGAGESEVVFTYHPRDLYVGFYIYLACLALLIGYAGWMLARSRRPSPTAAPTG